jgi:hypothetical protein
MNEWQLVHGYWAFLPPPGLLLVLLHSLVEQALLGHSIIHHQHSAVKCPRGTVFVTWNLCPSGMRAYSSSLPLYSMKDIGWDPIKYIKKIDEFYFSKKLAI